jgi:xanthine dehydrogenase iron-sulfur cluster and FAD-binding subunit A
MISMTHVKELQEIKQTQYQIYLGAGVTFTCLKLKLIQWINDEKMTDADGGFCLALHNQLKHFASTQIRNVASLGGNIIAASPM